MAASLSRKVMYLSSQLSAILPRIIQFNYSKNNVLISRVYGVRLCSSFKSKEAVVDGQSEPGIVDDHAHEHDEERLDMLEQELPKWRATRQKLARRYAVQGKASGIDPSVMWPTQCELQNIIRDEEEWCPSLQQMQSEIAVEKRASELRRKKREDLIAANMAKMPQMVAEHRKKVAEKRAVLREQMEKRNRLLEEAKDKLGYAIDPRSSRFQKMVQEIEKEERKKKKELKKKGIVV